jgi:hypothetical protein
VSRRIEVAIETGAKKAFATAVDWPGWSRSGKTPELALEALAAYADRYRTVAKAAGEPLPEVAGTLEAFEVVERLEGGGGTDFGVPSRIPDADRRPTTAREAARLRSLVSGAWDAFEDVAGHSPAELRKGPRGGGRDRDKMIGHVVGADHAYAHEIGVRVADPDWDDRPAIEAMRAAMLDVLGQPSDGSPLADRKWTARYAAGRIAWHALDHAWEMEDRADPA